MNDLRRLWAFLVRDVYNETSYRFAFITSVGGVMFRALTFFFLSGFIESATSPIADSYNNDYFSFVIIGIALGGYFGTGLNSFASGLRHAQITGTLEAMMMTPTAVSLIIIGSALWSYVYTTFRVLLYLLIGTLFMGLNLKGANYGAAMVTLLLSIISFASIGIITASLIMVVKKGEPITAVLNGVATLIGGIFFPITVLPGWLQIVANFLPLTHALRAMRSTLLDGASWQAITPDLMALLAFCVVLLPLSLIIFHYAVERARQDGSLSQY